MRKSKPIQKRLSSRPLSSNPHNEQSSRPPSRPRCLQTLSNTLNIVPHNARRCPVYPPSSSSFTALKNVFSFRTGFCSPNGRKRCFSLFYIHFTSFLHCLADLTLSFELFVFAESALGYLFRLWVVNSHDDAGRNARS
jgi:hypothetical protein